MDRLMDLTQAGIPIIGGLDMVLVSVETAVWAEALVLAGAVVLGAVSVLEWAGVRVTAEALVVSGDVLGIEGTLWKL
jgi:hypothetical protein